MYVIHSIFKDETLWIFLVVMNEWTALHQPLRIPCISFLGDFYLQCQLSTQSFSLLQTAWFFSFDLCYTCFIFIRKKNCLWNACPYAQATNLSSSNGRSLFELMNNRWPGSHCVLEIGGKTEVYMDRRNLDHGSMATLKEFKLEIDQLNAMI